MLKKNVFLVTGRLKEATSGGPELRGQLVQRVVCARDEAALHRYARTAFPEFVVIGVVNLAALEETTQRIKAALAGDAEDLLVFVDPTIQG